MPTQPKRFQDPATGETGPDPYRMQRRQEEARTFSAGGHIPSREPSGESIGVSSYRRVRSTPVLLKPPVQEYYSGGRFPSREPSGESIGVSPYRIARTPPSSLPPPITMRPEPPSPSLIPGRPSRGREQPSKQEVLQEQRQEAARRTAQSREIKTIAYGGAGQPIPDLKRLVKSQQVPVKQETVASYMGKQGFFRLPAWVPKETREKLAPSSISSPEAVAGFTATFETPIITVGRIVGANVPEPDPTLLGAAIGSVIAMKPTEEMGYVAGHPQYAIGSFLGEVAVSLGTGWLIQQYRNLPKTAFDIKIGGKAAELASTVKGKVIQHLPSFRGSRLDKLLYGYTDEATEGAGRLVGFSRGDPLEAMTTIPERTVGERLAGGLQTLYRRGTGGLAVGEVSIPVVERVGEHGIEAVPRGLYYTGEAWRMTQAPRMGGVMFTKVQEEVPERLTGMSLAEIQSLHAAGLSYEEISGLQEQTRQEYLEGLRGFDRQSVSRATIPQEAVAPVGAFVKSRMSGVDLPYSFARRQPWIVEARETGKLLPLTTQTELTRQGVFPYMPSRDIERLPQFKLEFVSGLARAGLGLLPKAAPKAEPRGLYGRSEEDYGSLARNYARTYAEPRTPMRIRRELFEGVKPKRIVSPASLVRLVPSIYTETEEKAGFQPVVMVRTKPQVSIKQVQNLRTLTEQLAKEQYPRTIQIQVPHIPRVPYPHESEYRRVMKRLRRRRPKKERIGSRLVRYPIMSAREAAKVLLG